MIQKMKIHKIWILSKRLLKGNAVKQTNKQTNKKTQDVWVLCAVKILDDRLPL